MVPVEHLDDARRKHLPVQKAAASLLRDKHIGLGHTLVAVRVVTDLVCALPIRDLEPVENARLHGWDVRFRVQRRGMSSMRSAANHRRRCTP